MPRQLDPASVILFMTSRGTLATAHVVVPDPDNPNKFEVLRLAEPADLRRLADMLGYDILGGGA